MIDIAGIKKSEKATYIDENYKWLKQYKKQGFSMDESIELCRKDTSIEIIEELHENGVTNADILKFSRTETYLTVVLIFYGADFLLTIFTSLQKLVCL